MSPPARRLFFAFWPDVETRHELARACRKAIKVSGGRPVAVDNLHVTVAFLGFVPQERLAEVSAVGAGLRTSAFDLVFDQVGHCADGVFNGRIRVDAVLVVQIDMVDAEAFQTGIECCFDIFPIMV